MRVTRRASDLPITPDPVSPAALAARNQRQPICAGRVGRYRRLERRRSSAGLQGVSRQLQADLGAAERRPPIPRRWAPRCAIPAARPGPPTFPTAPRRGPSSRNIFCRCESRGSAKTRASSPAITSRSSTARGPRPTSTPCRSIAGPRICSSAASSRTRPGLPNKGAGVSQDRPPQAGALLRSRRDRGRRDRRPRPRNLLAQEPDRSAVHADPGLGAGPSRGRLDHPHQLRRA